MFSHNRFERYFSGGNIDRAAGCNSRTSVHAGNTTPTAGSYTVKMLRKNDCYNNFISNSVVSNKNVTIFVFELYFK